MNTQTDAEISRDLALAIGWRAQDVVMCHSEDYVLVNVGGAPRDYSRFSYKDPAVIWPIAEWYDLFPMPHRVFMTGEIISWDVEYRNARGFTCTIEADTAAKAVALARIAAARE